MKTQLNSQSITVDGYIQGELESDIRHEYMGGEVYAMVGASDRHNLIAGNLFAALRPLVRGTPCQVFMALMPHAALTPQVRYPFVRVRL